MKKVKPYLLTSLIVLGILICIFLLKGIYPFGNNSLIWGDMHDQITAFYYHFYDCFYSGKSLLIDFTESGGVNFLGILAYYILSPLSFIVLLVKREEIYLVVSIIIAFKILLSSLTCLYFIRYYFKKIPALLAILLAIIYAFSGYSIIMYQITPWIDAMYMFPLVMIGLKKVLDLEKPIFYITTLTLSLIFSFYVSVMVVIFIFLASLIYLIVYKETKEERKKGIISLGMATVFSILLSLFIVLPSYLQISISSRVGFSMKTLLNSKTGPITDKASMFLFGGIMYVGILLLLKNYKKHKKFLTFYIPTLLIVLIPVMIEPIHKVWHFGSYAFFPYRFGFITMLLLVLGACYFYDNYQPIKGVILKRNKVISIVLTLVISISTFIIMYVNYRDFQVAVETLTISVNHWLLIVLVLSTFASIIGCFIILLLNKKLTKFSLILISIITITHILVNTSIYLGMDHEQESLMNQYEELTLLSKSYHDGDYYRVKNEASNMIMNSGMVMKYHTWDHFTSLTDKNNLESLKKLGYSSMWVKTFSRGGNLFLDGVLANRYIMSRKNIDNEYYYLKYKKNSLKFYELKEKPSYGYLMNYNDTIFDLNNSFEISNSFYKNITGSSSGIFDIINKYDMENLTIKKDNNLLLFETIDDEACSYLKTTIPVVGKKTIYLEVLKSLINSENYDMYEQFHIYVNGKLFKQNAFTENNNGVMNLGTFTDEEVSVRIEFKKSIYLSNVTIGVMDNEKYEDFIKNYNLDTNIKYTKNKIKATVASKEDKILFLPISYNDGYKALNNNKNIEIIKLYDNFIGIKLNEGINNIEITFIPQGFYLGLIISLISLVLLVVLLKTDLYNKILNNNLLSSVAYYSYLALYLGIILVIYIGLTICFMISYFKII